MSGNSLIVTRSQSTLTVTRSSIRIANSVYPIRNMAHFGQGEVSKLFLSWTFIFWLGVVTSFGTLFVLLLSVAALAASEGIGLLMGLVSMTVPFVWVAALIWKLIDPKHQGLLLVLNSGDRRLFVSTDLHGIANTVEVLFTILENQNADNGDRYIIKIDGSNVSGNIVVGSNTDDVVSTSSSRPTTPPPSKPTSELPS